MASALDGELDQFVRVAWTLWSEALLAPLRCLERKGWGTATDWTSIRFSVPAKQVSRVLVPGPLTVGIPRDKSAPERIPVQALRISPTVLLPGERTFRLVVDARQLGTAPGGTYWGEVAACADPDQPQPIDDTVQVWLVVP